jgi:uncharacterized NAD-dependent epimerase/dehydratase family protein
MTEMVRCPSCRGSKKVAKLGGVIGDCNTCEGKGQIKAVDKPVPVVAPIVVPVSEVMEATARVIQSAPKVGNIPIEKIQAAVESVSKPTNIYKRKKG